MEPIILVTEANIWCVKITVNAKWVMTRILSITQSRWESVGQGLSIELNKNKSKCSNILIGLDLAVFLCLQKYANVLHDMLGLMDFF